jgi:hypothetical protein
MNLLTIVSYAIVTLILAGATYGLVFWLPREIIRIPGSFARKSVLFVLVIFGLFFALLFFSLVGFNPFAWIR